MLHTPIFYEAAFTSYRIWIQKCLRSAYTTNDHDALGRWRQSGFISIGTLSSGEKTSAFWTPGAFVAVPWQSTRCGSIIYTLRVCLGLSKCPLAVSRETENGTLRMCLACELDFLSLDQYSYTKNVLDIQIRLLITGLI